MGAAAYHRGSAVIISECREKLPRMSPFVAHELQRHLVEESQKKRLKLIADSDRGLRIVHYQDGSWGFVELDQDKYPTSPTFGQWSDGFGYSGYSSYDEIRLSAQFYFPEIVAQDREASFCGCLAKAQAVYYCKSMSVLEAQS
jgi:hypothetical protein